MAMALSNVVCIIAAMVSTFWAAHLQHVLSSHAIVRDIPIDHPLASKVNLSVDVKMSVDDEDKHEVHNLLFSVPTHLLYDSVLAVLTPMQAKKLQNDIRSATDSVSQEVLDVKTDEPSNEPYVPKREEVVIHSTRPNQSWTTIGKGTSNRISKNKNKGSKAISTEKPISQPASLQTSPSTTSDGTRDTKQLSAARKKRYLKLEQHFATSASSATHIKSKTLSSMFRKPLSSQLGTMSVQTQSPTVVCQELDIEIKTDVYGSEITWDLKNDVTNEVVLTGGPYEDDVVTVNKYAACLYPGHYTFTIFDRFEDGIWDDGYYMLKLNGVLIHTGGMFRSIDVVPIKVVCQELDIEIKTDVYGSEITWDLKNDATNEVVLTGGPYEDDVRTVNNHAACLYSGHYTFIIFDWFEDGIWDDGYYMLKLNGVLIHTGKRYGNRDVVPIKVTLPNEAISNKPSVSSNPTTTTSSIKTAASSNHPTSKPSLSLKPTKTPLPTQYCIGEGQIQGQVRISGSDITETLIWDIFESKSDKALFEGGLGITDICVSEYGCYTFRIREGSQDSTFEYELLLGSVVQLEQNAININHHAKFGLRSCCKTSCCPTNQAHLKISIHSSGPTEDLSWRLYQSQDNTVSIETLVMEGGHYDGNQDLYFTESCVDPTVCHTLEVLGSNQKTSYESIIIRIDGEIKTREYNVPSGSSIEFCSICSTKPLLITDYDSHFSSDKIEVATFNLRLSMLLQKLSYISSQEQLIDTNTAQYKAACWIIFDDLLQLQSDDPTLVQRYVLAVLYHATGGDNWMLHEHKSKYLSNDSECDWNVLENGYLSGIECDEDGHIQAIRLGSINLTGRLPSEIAYLKYLERLILQSNSLKGNIPIELGRLTTLNWLDISNNDLVGTIPDSIFDLSELLYLNLGSNSLKGTLPTLVGKLYQLKYLYLTNMFRGRESSSIPEELFGIMSLKEIRIEENRLTGTISSSIGQIFGLIKFFVSDNMIIGTIPTTIGQLEYLETFHVQNNRLTGSIPSEMGQLEQRLLDLSLRGNQLQGSIPDEMGNMAALSKFYLNDNNLHGTIPSSLSKLHKLDTLYLHGNKLEGSMSKEICKLRDVELVSLVADCSDVNEYSIPEVQCTCCTSCVGQFSIIEDEITCRDSELHVEMSYKDDNWESKVWSVLNGANHTVLNTFYDSGFGKPAKSTYKACVAHTDCFTFIIDGDRWFDEGTEGSPYSVEYEEYYRTIKPYLSFSIYVDGVKIYDNDDVENQIWHGTVNFGYSDALGTTSLDQCDDVQFYGETYAVGSHKNLLLNQIVAISGYTTLLDESNAESQAAKWIFYEDKYTNDEYDMLQSIQRYGLAVLYYSTNGKNWHNSTNYITDKHECEWAGVTCDDQNVLEGLNLSGNNLVGLIPHEIGLFSMLNDLDLSHNKGLKGALPAEIQSLWSIQSLNISNCGISGPIPDNLWLLDNLNSLIMPGNLITGSLPREIINAKIEYVDLHDNSISGKLPKFGNETNLRELDLSSNYFEGNLLDVGFGLPLKHLDKLNLSRNLLTGTIPSDISISINLKTIDLSSNGLTGSIPSNLSNMKGLSALILSGNKLKGIIPHDIYSITGLKNVLLQNNELTGTISTQIGQLMELQTISLSYNNLKGALPEEIKYLKRNLKTFHVHFNTLVERTNWMTDCSEWNEKRSFIADCGTPTASISPLGCKCCTICCNSDGFCRNNEYSKYSPVQGVAILCTCIFVFLILCAFISKCMKKHNKLPFFKINLLKTVKVDSVYCFLLTNDKTCIFFVILVVVCQFIVFVSFLIAASYKTEGFIAFSQFQSEMDDWIYSKRCPRHSLECTDLQYITPFGWILFVLLMIFFMGRDVVMSMKLLYAAAMTRSYRLFLGGAVLLNMTTIAISASVFYNKAIAESDSQVILNALLLTVFSHVDEEAMKLLTTINETWVKSKLEDATKTSEDIVGKYVYHRSMIDEHRRTVFNMNQQEIIDNFDIDASEDEEEAQDNNRCCILYLFVDFIRTYTKND